MVGCVHTWDSYGSPEDDDDSIVPNALESWNLSKPFGQIGSVDEDNCRAGTSYWGKNGISNDDMVTTRALQDSR